MIALGIDPGPERSGVALLELRPGAVPRLVWGWHLEHAVLLLGLRGEATSATRWGTPLAPELVALERPERLYVDTKGGRAQAVARAEQLLATAYAAGELAEAARGSRRPVVVLSPEAWRAGVCDGRRSPTDAQVAACLGRLVAGMPSPRARGAAHVYDAAGVALAAGLAHRPARKAAP